jgi:hypothetical protein
MKSIVDGSGTAEVCNVTVKVLLGVLVSPTKFTSIELDVKVTDDGVKPVIPEEASEKPVIGLPGLRFVKTHPENVEPPQVTPTL